MTPKQQTDRLRERHAIRVDADSRCEHDGIRVYKVGKASYRHDTSEIVLLDRRAVTA